MGSPIIVPQRQSPWAQLLPQMFMMKMQHNYAVKERELEIETKKAQQKEQGKTALKIGGYKEVPKSAQRQMEQSGTQPSDVIDVYGSRFRTPAEPKFTPRMIKVGNTNLIETSKNKFVQESVLTKEKIATKAELLVKSAGGDQNAKATLDKIHSIEREQSALKTVHEMWGKLGAKNEQEYNQKIGRMADNIIAGKELIGNIKNAFGTTVSFQIRNKVLEKAGSDFNFILPKSVVKGLSSSIALQEKQRGAMGSFVGNIRKQVGRLEEIGKDIQRFDTRLLNVPMVAWRTRVSGSGKEKAYAAYFKEISSEISKLSMGSSQSIQQLSPEMQKQWEMIHDKNLSLAEVGVVLGETLKMAEMRLSSTDEELTATRNRLRNLNSYSSGSSVPSPSSSAQSSQIQLDADALIKKYRK